jgi:uncharacterized protein YkuJ
VRKWHIWRVCKRCGAQKCGGPRAHPNKFYPNRTQPIIRANSNVFARLRQETSFKYTALFGNQFYLGLWQFYRVAMYLVGTTRPVSKLHKEQNNSVIQLVRLIQNLTSMELSSIERQSPDSFFRESEEMCSVAFCNCVPIFKHKLSVYSDIFCSYLTFRWPCIVMYSYNESQRDALLLKFIW